MVAAGSLIAAGVGLAEAVHAQPATKNADADRKAASAKPDAAAAQKLVESGINALEAGRVDGAVASLSSAIASGSLPGPQMARALYYRGVAYRKQGKPALAIADLTSALWLRGGLTGNLRQEALQARAAAYREAGLPDPSASDAVRTTAAAPGGSEGEAKVATPAESGSQGAADGKTTVSVAPGGTFTGVNNFFNSLFSLGASASAPSPPATAG
ncbi:MAG TPA: tetratricopeptide repeat protein, partial [Hyphomicrobiaceae bacterium]|nr:tetratricopeptide repeat protein [Hyphomicrobiaceae bacterium]